MQVIILGGFLGSGKTSVLVQLAQRLTAQAPDKKNRIAIIENEIGDIGVDDQTLGGSGGYEVQSLFSGCVCCTLTGELLSSIMKLQKELDPDYVVLEPSGVADPGNIAVNIKEYLHIPVSITCLVDAERWEILQKAMNMLIGSQLKAARLILVNKVDKIDDDAQARVVESIRSYNDTARIECVCANKDIAPDILDAICGQEV